MAKVRRATPADTETLIVMGRAMHDESPRYRAKGFNPDKLRALAAHLNGAHLADNPNAAIFVAETGGELVGMFVAVAAERWFCDERFVTDLAVYVKPEHRGSTAFVRLVTAFEAWAREHGIWDLTPGVSTEINPRQTVCAYERLGYTLSGYTMTKTLDHGD